MDEKTEELRDIFLDVADDETVTESQKDERGSLAPSGDSVDERLQQVIDRLREKFDTTTPLTDEQCCEVIRRFYAGDDDEAIVAELGADRDTIFQARMELLLYHDDDFLSEGTLESIKEGYNEDRSAAGIATDLDLAEETVARTIAVLEARNRSLRVSHRFRTAYEEILTDADLSVQFTTDVHDDGLDEATEGAETNVEF